MGRKWRKKFKIAEYQKTALEFLKPPDDMRVSEWAEEYRVLDSKSSAIPGRWKNTQTPYLKGVMDELNTYDTEEIILCTCTQVGKTEAMNNMLGYAIQQDPGPAMIVYPTDKLAESISDNRIVPMVETAPTLKTLFDRNRSQKLELQFDGMTLTLAGSNSPSSLASKAIRYLFLDEVDKYPGASKKEADPISLARERTNTYRDKGRKIYMASTPTLKSGVIWKALEGADAVKHYFVKCPHCGEMIELKFAQLRWAEKSDGMAEQERADTAAYYCQKCGCAITDADKAEMLKNGEWKIVKEKHKVHRKIGFWLNVLYSPFIRFADVALEFMQSKSDPERLQNFTNSWLAEPWEDTQLKTSADTVMERRTELSEFTVPEWARMLTAGVDVQESSLYYTIRAWGEYSTSQNIAHGQVDNWAEIERVMNTAYKKEDGGEMLVELCLIDSGYNSDATYDFCALNADWAAPVKGSSNPNMINDFKLSTVNRPGSRMEGMYLVLVNGDAYKSRIANRLRKPNGRGSFMVYDGCDKDYAEQITSEQLITQRSGGRIINKWALKHSHADNHYLDCEVYAYAAADMRGLRSLHLQIEQPEGQPAKEPDKPEVNTGWTDNNPWLNNLSSNWI